MADQQLPVEKADEIHVRLNELIQALKSQDRAPEAVGNELSNLLDKLRAVGTQQQESEKIQQERAQAALEDLALHQRKSKEVQNDLQEEVNQLRQLVVKAVNPNFGLGPGQTLSWDFDLANLKAQIEEGSRPHSKTWNTRDRNEDEDEDGEDDLLDGDDLDAGQKVDALTAALKSSFSSLGRGSRATKEHESAKLTGTDPESWITFKDNFLTTSQLNEWTPKRAKLKLKAAVRDEAARAVQHIKMNPEWTLAQALSAYEEVFIHPAGVELAQAELERARKKADETLLAFHTRLRYLFLRAYPEEEPETSKKLKDLFSTQLSSLALSKELRTSPTYRQEKYTTLLTRAQDIEATYKTLQDAYKQNRGIHAIQLYDDEVVSNDATVNALAGSKPDRAGTDRGKPRCHACDAEDHLLRQCPFGRKVLDAIKASPQKFGFAKKSKSNGNGNGNRGNSGKKSDKTTINAVEAGDSSEAGN